MPGLLPLFVLTPLRFVPRLILCAAVFLSAWSGITAQGAVNTGEQNVEVARRAVVRIETTFFTHSYAEPWNQPVLRRSGGTGFIIQGNRIITNAHVVSRANTIRVQRPNQRTSYPAKILHIAHDCDLAMLQVSDPKFFQDSIPLEMGKPPRLNSPVLVVGFPIGGNRVSITRGIVSRTGMDTYSHSQVDWHKVIQVDAAINPGNSGGPAIQNGKVIGVAFQVYRRGENLGYLIPPEVVGKFLIDIKDGRYDGYIDFGTLELDTTNQVLLKELGLLEALKDPNSGIRHPDTGVLVYNVIPGSSAHGFIRPGDVLLKVNGVTLTHSGDVEIGGQMQSYSELVDNLGPGEMIQVEVWRDRKRVALEFPARRATILDFQRRNYDTPPSYYMSGGLLFQPVDANLFISYARKWAGEGNTEILYRYRYFLLHEIYRNSSIDVVLTRRISDPVNLYGDKYVNGIVDRVNGKQVRGFNQFVRLVDEAIRGQKYLILHFRGQAVPLVIRARDLKAATPRVLEKYGIPRDRYLIPGAP